ncbi:ABC transporter permease subunit [Paracoccus sp. S-4012]|uniref:ABC transporter permease n=1 Tax=Paracoccus sp. S-4012 TaxID=2665648 RepID=UPI0012AF1B67|nr:ABC transporter permease [Paracoccus sp. S-4012]MRX49549.1 ABC transporter permease subunit [Paracoccus sp. S-4012]
MFATIMKMLLRRLLVAIPTLLVVAALLFVVLRLLPVDPAAMSLPPNATNDEVAAMREAMGLNRPLPVQFLIWLGQLLSGDFGMSIAFRRPVWDLVSEALPATIELAFLSMIVATVVGVAGGLLAFYFRDRTAEAAIDFSSIVVLSLPEFLWALMLMLIFGVWLQWLPFMLRLDPQFERPVITGFLLLDTLLAGRPDAFMSALRHMILPVMALGISASPAIMRVLRSSLLDTYQEDYIHQARLRGLDERRVLLRHGLKNAFLPTLSLMGVQFGFLFGGTLLVEVIFSYPGLGNLMIDAIRNVDLPVIQIVGLAYCIMVLVISTVVDMLYLVLNPKLRVR